MVVRMVQEAPDSVLALVIYFHEVVPFNMPIVLQSQAVPSVSCSPLVLHQWSMHNFCDVTCLYHGEVTHFPAIVRALQSKYGSFSLVRWETSTDHAVRISTFGAIADARPVVHNRKLARNHFHSNKNPYFASRLLLGKFVRSCFRPTEHIMRLLDIHIKYFQPLQLPVRNDAPLQGFMGSRRLYVGKGRGGVKGYVYDPVFLIRLALFSGNLRDVSLMEQAASDAIIVLFGEDAPSLRDMMQQSGFVFPSAVLVRGARVRLDFACMAFTRLLFKWELSSNAVVGR
jgi:hypothetical protein